MSRLALSYQEPSWTSDGELLNGDRFAMGSEWKKVDFQKFSTRELCPNDYQGIHHFLDQHVQEEGFVYKDVVQPFAVCDWLRTKDFPVLILHRNILDVAYSMMVREWYYPSTVVQEKGKGMLDQVLKGLIMAEAALSSLKGIHLEYEDLTHSEEALHAALKSLYPPRDLPIVRYIDPDFETFRLHVEERKDTPLYQEIRAVLQEIELTDPVIINPK